MKAWIKQGVLALAGGVLGLGLAVGHNVLAEWTMDGQHGWGEAMDFIGLEQLCDLYTRSSRA